MGDYMCWSAPVDDLGDWRCEGVIYGRCDDPMNKDGKMCLYAPDVTVGPDGRYYLYYVLDKVQVMSVAVCDTPAGNMSFTDMFIIPTEQGLGNVRETSRSLTPGLSQKEKTLIFTADSAVREIRAEQVQELWYLTRICSLLSPSL